MKILLVDGFENYTVDTEGNITSIKTGKVLSPESSRRGYKSVRLYKNGKGVKLLIHRLVGTAFIANPNNKPTINHIDNNPMNNKATNLEWCTQQENVQHAARQGRMVNSNGKFRGEGSPNAKMTDKGVLCIKHYLSTKQLKSTELAMLFGVNFRTISNIKTGAQWQHLQPATVTTGA